MRLRSKSFRLEVKEITEAGEFAGYASVFNVKDSQGDVVLPGAFKKTLKNWAKQKRFPPMLWQHIAEEPIGVYKTMSEDEHGLYVEGRILREAGATERRAYEHLRAGTIDGLSIGYTLPSNSVEFDDEQGVYLLKEIDLWEVSLVTFPANPEATVDAVKSAIEGGPKEFERFLREAGLSRSQAKCLMARGYDGLVSQREVDLHETHQVEWVKSLIETLKR